MKYMQIFMVLLLAACDGGGDSALVGNPPPTTSGTTIAEIQGDSAASPLNGQLVTVSGVVTGDFQDNDADSANKLGGFYLQSESPDSNPETSEGVFVFDGGNPTTDVSIGDRVDVVATVNEYFGETQLNATTVQVTGSGSMQPVDVNLPAQNVSINSDDEEIADLERYEGMLVRFPQELTVSNLRFLELFGEVGLAQGARAEQFTNANPPGAADYLSHRRDVAMRSVVLDDGQRTARPATYRYLNIRAGDTITGLTGNLRYARGSGSSGDETWRLMSNARATFTSSNPRPGVPDTGGSFRVASLNVLNYFSTIDSGQPVCGPQDNENCRGADSAEELQRQTDKIVTALVMLNADVIGLIEIENDARDSISALVDALNARLGSSDYDFIDTGTIHDDAIKTALVYRTTTTQPIGNFAILNSSVDARFNDRRNRPALAQTFAANANGARLTVAVNHLKSKGSDCTGDGDPNLGDGQGNCNMTRTNAAEALADWLAADPTSSGDGDYLLIGDLNAYSREDPIAALRSAGLVDLLRNQANPYSFLFDGQIGALDHALASASLEAQVAGIREWHVNADEPPLLDYNLENGRDPELFDATTPYRSADHDPIVIGFELTN